MPVVKYQFNEHSFDNEEMVLKTKAQVMDRITCYVDPKNPKDIEQFAPKKDSLQVIAVYQLALF
ncbi:MAG: hypothetical protein HC819_24750 [Cyclobacteriaceae bacterium]|nr:hypothetical protein [Cyclobacteriaceae bacterium]